MFTRAFIVVSLTPFVAHADKDIITESGRTARVPRVVVVRERLRVRERLELRRVGQLGQQLEHETQVAAVSRIQSIWRFKQEMRRKKQHLREASSGGAERKATPTLGSQTLCKHIPTQRRGTPTSMDTSSPTLAAAISLTC